MTSSGVPFGRPGSRGFGSQTGMPGKVEFWSYGRNV